MRRLALTAFCSVLALGLSACGSRDKEGANKTVVTNQTTTSTTPVDGAGATGAGATTAGATTAGAASAWPAGSRIMVENGVTYRVDATGARVRLEASDSRIVTEKGVRYRVDPGGARVRIDQRGDAVKVGESTITGNAPNGRSDRETPGEAATDVAEDAVEAVGDVVD